ncbi:MAG: hypothetical protein K9N23_17915 [Akkermansiaceae bacterium]|nr:hypothetical protein [Akkermansiaceae bacterium]MCF7733571.1 hypothetical protein [Akkermansiaceae bacterium]
MRPLTLALILATAAPAADLWELPPTRYAGTPATDPIALLAADLASGRRTLEGTTPLERLRTVLRLLEIPVESQILVFSKTSKQNNLITPTRPRSIFFNENAYLGYVPGGVIEVIVHDPALGVVYYSINPRHSVLPAARIQRDVSDCLSCHGTARTESVPGMLVRSVFPDRTGQPILPLGSFLTDHHSPIGERWGGYYVTGTSSLPHLGNRTFEPTTNRPPASATPTIQTLSGRFDTTRYLRPTSDIVALMILEHQCTVHNHLTAAAIQYRRSAWLQQSLDPGSDPATGSPGQQADIAAHRIVDLLLFKDEAPLGADGIEGDPAYQEAFTARFPQTPEGRSLADFNLYDRIFKHRCSFMIHSKAFAALPQRVKSAVFARLREALSTESEIAPHLSPQERTRIDEILRATVPGYR